MVNEKGLVLHTFFKIGTSRQRQLYISHKVILHLKQCSVLLFCGSWLLSTHEIANINTMVLTITFTAGFVISHKTNL